MSVTVSDSMNPSLPVNCSQYMVWYDGRWGTAPEYTTTVATYDAPAFCEDIEKLKAQVKKLKAQVKHLRKAVELLTELV